tara:strand:+ start:728 stop:1111 length:384 start_codon:yes stop_codon:yes gene_type:complete
LTFNKQAGKKLFDMLSSGVEDIDIVLECKEGFEESFNKSKKFDTGNLYFMMLIYFWLIPQNKHLEEFVHKILGIFEYLPDQEKFIGEIDVTKRTRILRIYFAENNVNGFTKAAVKLTREIFQQYGWW